MDEEAMKGAEKMLARLGPVVLKMTGFGEKERVAMMDGLAFIIERAKETAQRARAHEKQLADALATLQELKGQVTGLEESLARSQPVKKPGQKGGA